MSAGVRRVTLLSPYALSAFGGVQEQVLSMSRELSRREVEVQIVAPNAADVTRYDTPAKIERLGRLVVVPANGSRAPLTLSPRAGREASSRIEKFAPDVVHLHEPFAPRLGWPVLRAHGVASVATFHRSGEGRGVKLAAPLLHRWARHLDVSTAVSRSAAATAYRLYGITPDVLFNGFEVERFVAYARETQADPTLVVVGRLEARKGVAVAIAAVLAHNERAREPWRLVVIGEGPERSALEAASRHDGAVQFLGALDDDQKRRWLRRADVVVAPATHGESFGLTLLEAMASETRVVASDIPGYRDAAGSHVVLFEPSNLADLERALEVALATRDPGTLERAREHAEHWSMGRLVDEYLTLYHDAQRRFAARR